MSPDHAPDPIARIAELLEQSSLNEPALHRLYARIPHRAAELHATRTAVPVPVAGLATRLNRLFETVHAPGARPHTNSEVAAQLTAWGHPISKPYLSQLRSGVRTDPSRETIAALARFFRVRPDYFADDAYTSTADRDYALLAQLQFDGLRTLSVLAFDLSEESQNLLTAMADRLRVTERLPEVGAGGAD